MKLIILGASGGCGRWCTRLALERGHEVTALLRPAAELESDPGLRIARGDPLDAPTLTAAASGAEAVLCCVGIRRSNQLNPWSKVLSPRDLVTRMSQLLVEVLPRVGIKRLILISAAGVGDSAARTSPVNKWLFAHSKVGISYRDLEIAEKLLASSTLDWMAVRPTTLVNGPPRGSRIVDYYGAMTRIRRSDVANFMLNAVIEPSPFAVRTPMIAG